MMLKSVVVIVAALSVLPFSSAYSINRRLTSKVTRSNGNVFLDEANSNFVIEDKDKRPASSGSVSSTSTLPFPRWLRDFTGMTDWPGIDPPYIPLDFIKFDHTLDITNPQHVQGDCQNIRHDNSAVCSFDCYNCVSHDDIFTCPKLSQTFDDGPSLFTNKLVAQLGKSNTKSTFFTIGLNVVRYPEVYRNTHRAGHIMGSHTWSHRFLPSLTNEQIVAQIEWSIWAMNATAGHLPKWFRPPYGGVDNRVRSIVRQFGMQSVLWDFDTFDWKLVSGGSPSRSEAQIYTDIDEFARIKQNRGIILEHDSLSQTVDVGVKLNQRLGSDQLTIPQCVGGIDYIKTFS